MCGRYTLRATADDLAEHFGLSSTPDPTSQRFNIAPTSQVSAVVATGEGRRLETLRWGLVPPWADDPSIGARMINARSETAHEKPSFRRSFRERRCLLPADGFYEWRRTEDGKQPYHIRRRDGGLFAFAGLWESWGEERLRTGAILTTSANAVVGEVHERMPVILAPEDYALWLDTEADDPGELIHLMRPFDAGAMEAYPVSRFVNRPTNDAERCVEPVA